MVVKNSAEDAAGQRGFAIGNHKKTIGKSYKSIGNHAGWWFGTWILWFSIYWECHHPNWRTHIFQMGRSTTNHKMLHCVFTKEKWWLSPAHEWFAGTGGFNLSRLLREQQQWLSSNRQGYHTRKFWKVLNNTMNIVYGQHERGEHMGTWWFEWQQDINES